MGEVKGRRDINNELDRLHSEKVEVRSAGLIKLTQIIREKRQDLKQVNDIGYHTILETVFRVAKIESSNYARGTKYTKTKAESRLSACGTLVRVVVQIGLRKLRYKTVKALLEHITQTLPTADAGYCAPLCKDYFKALVALLEFKAHPEHFLGDDWHDIVDFCLDTARDLNKLDDVTDSVLSNGARALQNSISRRENPTRSATPSTMGDHGRMSSLNASQPAAYPHLRDSQLELAHCLQHVISVPNAPLFDRVHLIVTTTVDLLVSYPKVSSIQQVLFDCISSVMSRVVAHDTKLALHLMEKILPLFRRFWDGKDHAMKESLLIILSYGEVLLPRLISEDTTGDRKTILNALVEVMRDEYCARRHREQLLLDDLAFVDPTCYVSPQVPLSNKTLQVRTGMYKAEQPWCLICLSAAVLVVLEKDTALHEDPVDTDQVDYPPKRQRLTRPLDDIFSFIKGSVSSEKLYALQILVFIFDDLQFDENSLQGHLDLLLPCLSDDDGSIASWAMLVITSATGQRAAHSMSLKPFWLDVWRIAARHITSSSTCRAACHLMTYALSSGLVQYVDVADLVDGITRSVDLNGPADCDESATLLWTMLLVLRGRDNLNSAPETSGSVLRWLFSRWSPAKLGDRHHAIFMAQQTSAFSNLRLICVCLGLPPPSILPRPAMNLGPLSQARMKFLRDRKLMKYLLQTDLTEEMSAIEGEYTARLRTESVVIKLSHSKSQSLVGAVLDFFVTEGSGLLRAYFPSATEPVTAINADIVHACISFGIVGYALLSSSRFHDVGRKNQLVSILNDLNKGLKHCMLHHNDRRELIKGFFESYGRVLGSIEQIVSGTNFLISGAIAMSHGFDQKFWSETLQSSDISKSDIEQDGMNMDDDFDSQRSQSRDETFTTDSLHFEIPASTNATAFRACVAAKLCFMSNIKKSGDAGASVTNATTALVPYLTSLPGQDFLASRPVLVEFLDSHLSISRDDAFTLLEYLAQTFLRIYEHERSEVSMGIILDVMTSLADIWSTDDGDDACEMGEQLYTWFIETALKKGISSAHVHIRMSSMLQRVIKVSPEYGKSVSLPSARTCLFEVLADGNIVVKFHIGNNIANIFGLFVLNKHERLLEDLIDTLPKDPHWIEGIALRLFVIAHLAASWSTLLRYCTYKILECAGAVPSSAGHAQSCLQHIATSLKLAYLKDLFKLFVPQIFYTWLEAEDLRSFPYVIFGYGTSTDLLRDVQDELVSQILLWGKNDEATQLADSLGTPFETLLEISFSKAAAYCIARDVAMSSTIRSPAPHAEARVRSHLSKEQYTTLVAENFPEILAVLFKTIDMDGQIEKGFQKHPTYSKAFTIYQEILSKCGPDKTLPNSQQPSFRANHLIDEIEYLCRRSPYDAESLWSPELYVYVLRNLLSSIQPALGSLHTCAVLRKIRIMISLAGATALEQYPLEMALHSLMPYMTDAQCAQEAIGLVQYLLGHGTLYLQEIPSFLAGHAVSTLTSMKAFFDSTQDSTTQESQFLATMSRAQAFHTWFSAFLGNYVSPHLSEDSAKCFKTIINAASHIQTGGNAKVGTYESELLLELLEDQRSGRNLLDQSCRDIILRFLCMPFEVPSDFREDILGSDENAAQYASIVWKTCQRGVSSPNYRLWVGRVIGRAYAGKGLIDREMVNETFFERGMHSTSAQATTASSSSRTKLLSLLCEILQSDQSSQIGCVEITLRSILTETDGTEDFPECDQVLPSSLMKSLLWRQFHLPVKEPLVNGPRLQEVSALNKHMPAAQWIQQLCTALVLVAADDPILSELSHVLQSIEGFAEKAFPYILHLVLLRETGGHQTTRRVMSEACQEFFRGCTRKEENTISSVRILLQAILYLRTQPLPNETSKADRAQWLELDYNKAAAAAISCSMFKTALLFLEIDVSEAAKTSRRSSAIKSEEPSDLLLTIYEQIDEQDAFYGVQQPSSLSSMMARLEYEHAGFKSLSFRGAHYDGKLRLSNGEHQIDEESMVRALDNLDLNGLSQSLLSRMTNTGPNATDSILRTARKLEQWDISPPASHVSSAGTVFRAFQNINSVTDIAGLSVSLNPGFSGAIDLLMTSKGAKSAVREVLSSLAILTEADEVFSCRKSEQLYEVLGRFEYRDDWMHSESYEHIKGILSCRETSFSMLSKKPKLQDMLKTTQRDVRSLEGHLLLASSQMSRLHDALQHALSTATYLTQLVTPCENVGIDISAAVRFESAKVLWGQGEMTASINMLQDLKNAPGSHSQLVEVGKSELLATLGHQISEARLEKPDEIINHYLTPAIKELHGAAKGDEAGQVFHEFASFCDQQLQNPDSLEDFNRIHKLRDRKVVEVKDLERMISSKSSQARERENLRKERNKTQAWLDLDDREYQRLRDGRETFLRQSLENYLLCLKACDKYDNDALRFSALWLENSESEIAYEAVSKLVGLVGSRKFAALMNQFSSRLLEDSTHFQTLLASLVLRICIDHPYHGMYQIFAGSKSKGGKDNKALSRNAAANSIAAQLKSNKRSSATWMAIHNTNISFVRFAAERLDDSKQNSKVLLRRTVTGPRVEQDVQKQRIPPPTAKIELRADCDYSNIPSIARFQPEFSIAGGISAPKIVTAIDTDGVTYKMLFKGGNDDLRQDSIMEQVFEQVSNLLRTQRATRQRNLGIRTYKVLPLTAREGIIEFVQNTIPLHDYLIPAHERHFPKDLRNKNCRKFIADVQSKSVNERISVYRKVCQSFHPVLHYFFMERFDNPDDWFEKRLAYTRSTAAISILGHILGLGDRHGHNILLDNETGEVVHIDLGVAFEQGRILNVPEVVPFRLTRDLVDGMGITKTEGVFRRCCEFTLEALRNESYSIMTILDVLRYDPLYSWSVSPLRLKKMQDAQTEDPKLAGAGGNGGGGDEGEPGEADRALTVVKKKLSRSLSVQATVNELIQQATDERNLAVLYCGWAAYV